jgi:hypothetical protein
VQPGGDHSAFERPLEGLIKQVMAAPHASTRIVTEEETGVETVRVACLDLSSVIRFAATQVPMVDAADCLAVPP